MYWDSPQHPVVLKGERLRGCGHSCYSHLVTLHLLGRLADQSALQRGEHLLTDYQDKLESLTPLAKPSVLFLPSLSISPTDSASGAFPKVNWG